MSAHLVQPPRLARGRIRLRVRHRFDFGQHLESTRRIAETHRQSSLSHRSPQGFGLPYQVERGASVVEATAIQEILCTLQGIAGKCHGASIRGKDPINVPNRCHGFGGNRANGAPELARPTAGVFHDAIDHGVGERRDRAAHEILSRTLVDWRHMEHRRRLTERNAADTDDSRSLGASGSDPLDARFEERIGVVDEDGEPFGCVSGELCLDRARRIGGGVVDPRDLLALDSERPCCAAEERAASRTGRTIDAQERAGLEGCDRFAELGRGLVDADHRPERRAGRQRLGCWQARRMTKRARELVRRGIAGARFVIGRPIRHGFEASPGRFRERAGRFDELGEGNTQRIHFGAHREGTARHELGCCVPGREPFSLSSLLTPGSREPEIDQRRATAWFDDDVRGLDVPVEEPGSMNERELLRGASERIEGARRGSFLD